MAKYFYVARAKNGDKVTGVEEAFNQDDAVSRLQSRGLMVLNVLTDDKTAPESAGSPKKNKSGLQLKRSRHYRISGDDLVLLCRQLATLLGAGVTILKSLDIICQQSASRRLYTVLRDLQRNMEAGLSLHEAMAKHPTVFSELWINLVESGEASGNLATVLNRLAGYLEKNAQFKQKIISALLYPTILFVAGTSALLFLSLKIIPTFAELFANFKMDLPFLTKILIAVSTFLKSYFLFLIGMLVVSGYLIHKYVTTSKEGRKQFERFLFKLPVAGEFFRVFVIERFTSEMATLVESGVPILYSLEIAEHSVGNLTLGEIIRDIKDSVREGKSLSQPMEDSGFFDPMAVQMVNIGEEIGELSQMFKKLNSFYQEYIEVFLVRFTTMFEPAMLIVMGFMVGLMVIGMFLPIFQIADIGSVSK